MATSSQRQKKRNAQMKRKKYEHKHQASGRPSQSKDQVISEQETPQMELYDPVENPSAKMETSKEQENEACQIAYEIPVENNDTVNMEQLEESLAQLLSSRIPSASIHHPPPPEDKSQAEDLIPSISLSDLAASMSSLPLHQRLFIEKELVDLCEERRSQDSNTNHPPLLPMTSSLMSSHITTLTDNVQLNEDTASPPSLAMQEEKSSIDKELELNALLKKDKETKLKDEESTQQGNIAVKDQSKAVHHNTELDSALDELLDM